ncbi:hypothetical protein K474DRAFT_1609486 [Panus rudis PR-1116 ss-1]|nr:hypothetical protein K474DRAFT_1609486 [Panus rudis PR-1116 ss-1]
MTSAQKYDPRMGDEPENDNEARFGDGHTPVQKHVRLELQIPDDSNKKEQVPLYRRIVHHIPVNLQWIPDNWSWSKIKPVIRNAVLGWVSMVLLLIPESEKAMGQASFLILIASFLDPPSEPFIAVLEREVILVFLVCVSWAWSTLGVFLANLARTQIDYNAPFANILSGQYVEAAPTVIYAVFIFVGCSIFLYIKARQGPGPFLFGCVFACVCVDISLTTANLFPYPFYQIGKAIVIPLSIHAGLSVLAAAVIFPATITAQYTAAFGRVLEPLNAVLSNHRKILELDPTSSEFKSTASTIAGLVGRSEANLASAGAVNRLLKRDIVWGRFAPANLAAMQGTLRRLVVRSNGMGVYFTLIDPTREKFPVTPVPSTPATPAASTPPSRAPSRPPSRPTSRPTSRAPSPDGSDRQGRFARRRRPNATEKASSPSPLRHAISQHLARHFSPRHQHHSSQHHDHHLHLSLLHFAHNLSPLSRVSTNVSASEAAVGVFESQRYLAFESTRLASDPDMTARFTWLLHESCDELLETSQSALKGVQEWVAGVRRSSFGSRKKIEAIRKARLEGLEQLRDSMKESLERFRKDKRLRVLDPYRSAFDPKHVASPDYHEDPPPHRFLFHCYVYEYHVMEFANLLVQMLDYIIDLEKRCKKAKLWLPSLPLSKLLIWSRWETELEDETHDDEDPDTIPGITPEEMQDLGMTRRRDPDALPPSNIFELVMSLLYRGFTSMQGGNALYALKAGVLTVVLCLPSFLSTTAAFAYGERFVWGVFMGQLTLGRWRGDTTFGLVSRIIATFWGCAIGLAMWYISTGTGHGNPYGLAAVCAVCFPFFYYARLYWPGPPMTNAIFFVTTALIVGYSWQNTHFPFGFTYYGWELAWRRFIIVVAGVTAAFIFGFLPPSNTLRYYHRRVLATTVSELGSLYCSIVSFANTHRRQQSEVDRDSIVRSLIAIRMKLKRSMVLKTNIVYEFSLRGQWPSERYQKILEIQLQIAYLLSHLMSVVEHLEPAWARAFLRRTRFLDSDFQGDVLAVITLISTALRTGNPLPQITPCPLLDRFMAYTHGLNVIRHEADDDYGLPRTMTIDTLENEQYLRFSVGVTTAFGIVSRLDRLMVATKELVGEQYHIHGVGMAPLKNYADGTGSASIRPAKDA